MLCQAGDVLVDGFAIRNGRYGVYVTRGTASLSNCTVTRASYFGVAVSPDGTLTMCNSLVSGNTKYGVYVSDGAATLNNNTISGNGNHGVNAFFGATLSMCNNIIAFNTGRGVSNALSAFPTFSHNDVYGNTAGDYSSFTPPADQGNLSVDPLFVDRPNGDFHLQAASPCIDAGDDSVVSEGSTDLDGFPRIQGTHVDIGACEFGAVGPLPFTLADVAKCLSIACGLSACSADDLARLNVEPDNAALDLRDVLRLARKVAGTESNPLADTLLPGRHGA